MATKSTGKPKPKVKELDVAQFHPKPVAVQEYHESTKENDSFARVIWWITFIGMLVVCISSVYANIQISKAFFGV